MLLISALAVGVPSVCWLLSSWRKSAAIERTAQRALTDCPSEKRAGVLRATAELAGQLCVCGAFPEWPRRPAPPPDRPGMISGR